MLQLSTCAGPATGGCGAGFAADGEQSNGGVSVAREETTWFAFGLCLRRFCCQVPRAGEKIVVSIWGGSWGDIVAARVAKRITAGTGVAGGFFSAGAPNSRRKGK